MKNLLRSVPGFRSNKQWKKILSTLIHIILLLLIIITLTSTSNNDFTSTDHLMDKISSILFVLFIYILPYILITNLFGMRKKLPLFRRNSILGIILGSALSVFVIIMLCGITSSVTSNYYSPQYKAAQAKIEAEKITQERAETEKKAQEQAQLAEAKAKENTQKQAQLAEKKAEAEKAAQAKAKTEEDSRKQVQLVKEKTNNVKDSQSPFQITFDGIKNFFQTTFQSSQDKSDSPAVATTNQVQAQTPKVDTDNVNPAQVQASSEQSNEISNVNSTQVTDSDLKTIPGFVQYESDGFKIQLPNDWSSISSEVKYGISGDKNSLDSKKTPLEKDYDISYRADDGVNFSTTIEIIPISTFNERKSSYMYPNNFQFATVKKSDLSYVAKDFSNSMVRPSSYKVIAIKGDICYILSCYFRGYNELDIQGGFYDYRKEMLQKYLSDIQTMVPSFELTSKYVDFNSTTQTNQSYVAIKSL